MDIHTHTFHTASDERSFLYLLLYPETVGHRVNCGFAGHTEREKDIENASKDV